MRVSDNIVLGKTLNLSRMNKAQLVSLLQELEEERNTALANLGVASFDEMKQATERALLRDEKQRSEKLALELANTELRDLTANLDKIVRRRTQALVESEEQLRRSTEELKRLNLTKREFVSIAAHELRTPLTSMVGYLELMAEGRFGTLNEKLDRPMRAVRRNALRLRRLVDEMLDVSRIEADRMILRKVKCNAGDISAAVVQELLPLAETKDQRIETHFSECPDMEADVDKIHQVISNLVGNAIRYCPTGGGIDVHVDHAPLSRYPGNWARIRVRDDGPGIHSSDLDAIFEPFSDVNPAKHHSSRGPAAAGLGLYIARGLVDLHEGIITVKSEPGKYTEFSVLLPALDSSV